MLLPLVFGAKQLMVFLTITDEFFSTRAEPAYNDTGLLRLIFCCTNQFIYANKQSQPHFRGKFMLQNPLKEKSDQNYI